MNIAGGVETPTTAKYGLQCADEYVLRCPFVQNQLSCGPLSYEVIHSFLLHKTEDNFTNTR